MGYRLQISGACPNALNRIIPKPQAGISRERHDSLAFGNRQTIVADQRVARQDEAGRKSRFARPCESGECTNSFPGGDGSGMQRFPPAQVYDESEHLVDQEMTYGAN